MSIDGTEVTTECRVYYALYGDFDPDEITRQAQMAPTNTWRKGEPSRLAPGRHYERARWRLDSRLPASSTIKLHVADVLDQLQPSWDVFAGLGREYDAMIQCVLYVYEAQGGGSNWPLGVLQRIVDLHAQLDIDSYCLGDSGPGSDTNAG